MKKSNLVIYIHGFKASHLAAKGLALNKHFKEDFINPSLPISPKLAYLTLEQLIKAFSEFYEQITLVGSSLGGFLSICLLNRFPTIIKAVLVNPAVHAEISLRQYLGANKDFAGTEFVLSEQHIQEIVELKIKSPISQELQNKRVLLLVQTGDTVLNYKEAIEYLPYAQTDVFEGGDHSYVDFEKKFDLITEFIKKQ